MGNSETARYGDGRQAHDPFALLRPILKTEWRRVLETVHEGLAASRLPTPTSRQLARLPARSAAGDSSGPQGRAPPDLMRKPTIRARFEALARTSSSDPAEAAILADDRFALDPAGDGRVLQKLFVANAIEAVLARATNRILRAAGRAVGPSHRAVLRTHLVAALAAASSEGLPQSSRPNHWIRELRAWSRSPPGRRVLEDALGAAFLVRRATGAPGDASRRLDTFLRNPPMRTATEPECL